MKLYCLFLEMIEDSDTYIVRDVLMDDILFITPEDAINNTNNFEILYENDVRYFIRRHELIVFFLLDLF